MTEALHDILRTYLDVGYTDIQGFWQLTLPEIVELLQAAQRKLQREQQRKENETKQQAIMLRNLSLQTGESVACLFDKNKRTLTPLSEYYPGLFKAEEIQQEVSLETYTALWEDYAYRYNERMKRKRGEVNGCTGHDTEEAASGSGWQHAEVTSGNEASGSTDEEQHG